MEDNTEIDSVWPRDEEGKPLYKTIDMSKQKPIYPPKNHECSYTEEPDLDYPDRYYLTCKCGHSIIINK